MIDYISKRLTFSAYCEYEKMHGFNFVMDIQANAVGMLKLKKKSYNISFEPTDTYADALARKETIVTDIYNKYCNMLIRQFKTKLDVETQPNNLRSTRLPQSLLKAYQMIDGSVRDKVVNMETFCGYPSAIVQVGTITDPLYFVMVISKSAKYLSEGINIVLKYGFDYWNDYHNSRINILPHGFTYNLRKYDSTYSGDKSDFKEFLESYEDYQYDLENDVDNGIDYYFNSWKVPAFLE